MTLKMNARAVQDAQEVAREAAALKRAANAGDAALAKEKTDALKAAIGIFFSFFFPCHAEFPS